jgi:hypothetical protein
MSLRVNGPYAGCGDYAEKIAITIIYKVGGSASFAPQGHVSPPSTVIHGQTVIRILRCDTQVKLYEVMAATQLVCGSENSAFNRSESRYSETIEIRL